MIIPLLFDNKFKYLGHIIENSFSDDSDINREIKTLLFTRTSVPCRRFKRCSLAVKEPFSYLLCVFMMLPHGLILLLVHLTD